MQKSDWLKSMRVRMALTMSLSGVLPIIICHAIVAGYSRASMSQVVWYIPLIPILIAINWILAGVILIPIRQLLQGTTELVSMDIRKRLDVDPHEPIETLELRQSFNKLLNRLEESLNIQCQFVADASHELRTPLTSIQGYTKLLLRRGSNIDANLLAEALQTISDESGRLIRLVSDLLQLARADAGQAIINQQEPIDIRTVLGSVEDTVTVIAPEQIEVQFILSQNPIYVLADSDRLKQVFLNLINNAIKATQGGGKVTVTLRVSNNHAVVRVIDTGIGIAPADQQRIFDRFYRVERSRTRSRVYGGGTGLGLAIALTIIKAHKGGIELESELNKGSTFTIRLPMVEKDGKAISSAVSTEDDRHIGIAKGSSKDDDYDEKAIPPQGATGKTEPTAKAKPADTSAQKQVDSLMSSTLSETFDATPPPPPNP
jgi:signal transduction histidine kinase